MQSSPVIPRLLAPTIRHRPSNLIPALLLLGLGRRGDALLFAGWCRHVDDIADAPCRPAEQKRGDLEAWMQALDSAKGELLPTDFGSMIRRRSLDREQLREILRGMLMDTGRVRFENFDELEPYCRKVASAVGLVSARIFGAEGPAAERYAVCLGVALQLTNILRDVAEDATLDRIYIPREDMDRFGVTEEEILGGRTSPAMTHLLNHQAERADSWFAKAEIAWSELPANQKRLMRPARLMSAIYREILLTMHRDRYDVFVKRYRVPRLAKARCLLRVMISGN